MAAAAALSFLLLLVPARGVRADEVAVRPPAQARASSWLARVLALAYLSPTMARRDAARDALAVLATQARPDPEPYRRAAELAQACIAAAPSPALVDVEQVSRTRGVSITQIVHECEILRASAANQAERAQAEREQRAQEIRPLLKGDRLKVFDAEGEPDCEKCAGEAKQIARAREWIYVRGPSGPLATYETMTFVFRGDRLIERKQRRTHERP